MQPPNTDNLTIPGGIILFFDEGGGMVDLGHIDPNDMSIKTASDELKVETQRSGKVRTLKTFPISEEVQFDFRLIEPVLAHLRLYFKGGDITTVGAGSGTVTDQLLALAGTQLVSVGKYGISSPTVRQFLDKCLLYDGAAYVDNSTEADLAGGAAFLGLQGTDDFFYIGKNTNFKQVYFDLAVNGDYGDGLTWEYWNGATWAAIVDKAGAGADMEADGVLTHTPQSDWVKNAVNSLNYYWLRASAAAVNTPAQVNHIRQNLVLNTDYVMDPGQASGDLQVGRIGRLAAGLLVDGEEVKASYTYTTWSSLTMPLAFTGYKEGAARLQFHPSTGLQGNYHIPKCQIKPNGELSFNPKDVLKIPLSLVVLDDYDNNPTYPFGYWEALSEAGT
jgi:hypothetical protein